MAYSLPTNTDYVSCSYDCHASRNPPSSEPGTDYASASGSPLYASGNGRVAALSRSNSNATGRYLTIDMDDGRRTRSLHLAEIWVEVGWRVEQGQQIGVTGASGFGSNWGYGAHVHQTLIPSHSNDFANTLDFALYVGDPDPDPIPGPTTTMEDDMPAFFDNGRVIVWPNGWANSYDPQVYNAMKGYALDPTNPGNQWVEETWVRENWAALDGVQAQQVKVAQQSATRAASSAVGIGIGVLGLVLFVLGARRGG